MSTSDADKPPICSPDLLSNQRANPPRSETGSGQEMDDTNTRLAQPSRAPGTLLHWTFLVIAAGIVFASFSLSIRNRVQVVLPIVNAPLPGTCTFLRLTGLPCPGCGLTRSFISMGHGRIHDAWSYNPAGFFFFAIVLFQIPYRVFQIVRIRRGHVQHRFARIDTWTLIALAAVLVFQWAWHLIARLT